VNDGNAEINDGRVTLRRTSQTVAAIRSADSASRQPPSTDWNSQNRLAGC
jgi:hypothetical protein